MMKVLLITPNLKGSKEGLNRIQPPLGLMLSAAVIRDRGHDVMIHDSALSGWFNRKDIGNNMVMIGDSDDDILKLVSDYSPDVVGISALFSNLMDSAHKIASVVKEVDKNIVVVLGGNHISSAIRDYKNALIVKDNLLERIVDLEDKNIDFSMYGEVEFDFAKLIDILSVNNSVDDIDGLVYKKNENGSYHINKTPEKNMDLDTLPMPARDLVDMEGYFKIGAFHSPKSRSKRVLSLMASRGCPEKCTFCTTPDMWGAKVRWRSVSNIIDEIKHSIDVFNIEEIQFEDDTITARRKNLIELCGELKKIGLPWCTPNGVKVDYHLPHQPEMFKAMFDSGCYQITLACETGVQDVMDNIVGKRLNVETIVPSIENAKNAGMLVHTFWILGFPGESYSDIKKTIDFALKSGADSYSFAILSPLPGTPIYKKVVKENLFWDGMGIDDLTYRSSLIKVDGFDSPYEFEKFISDVNYKANNMLRENDPDRFRQKYGTNLKLSDLQKQT